MKNRKLSAVMTLVVALVLLSGMTSAPVMAANHHENNGNNIVLTNDEGLSVQILGGANVPQFTYWDNADEANTTYRVSLSSIFEADDDNDDGVYANGDDKKVPNGGTSLSSVSWEFSEFDEENNGDVHFTMTSTNLSYEIQFAFHLYADDDTSIKFDVIINGYEFTDDDAMLVLAFSLKVITKGNDNNENEDDNPDTQQNGNTVKYGEGYFNIEDTASDANGDIGVGLSASNAGTKQMYVAYGHFSGDLTHDPTIGVRASSLDEENSESDERLFTTGLTFEGLSLGDTVAPSVLATFGFLSVILVISRKKRA